ncbi:MAG: hypothetical protein GSR79_07530 [Desulfurococcales archaeon]|nr:hypothetical protein [Desulfurococcales archaeon]
MRSTLAIVLIVVVALVALYAGYAHYKLASLQKDYDSLSTKYYGLEEIGSRSLSV